MALTRKKIDDEELISYIFVELDFDYNSMVSALVVRPDTLSIGEVYSQLLSYKQRIERQQNGEGGNQASAHTAGRGRGNVRGRMGSRGGGYSPSRCDITPLRKQRFVSQDHIWIVLGEARTLETQHKAYNTIMFKL
jgi:hypothetical protein